MTIPPSVIPLASTAVNTIVQGVNHLVENATGFSELFSDQTGGSADSNAEQSAGESDALTHHTPLGQRAQRAALQQQFENLRQAVHRRLVQGFGQRGVELTEPAVLTLHDNGRILESGGHWERGKIEQTLQSDPELQADVAQLIKLGNTLRGPGPSEGEADATGTPRLVVGRDGTFFQLA